VDGRALVGVVIYKKLSTVLSKKVLATDSGLLYTDYVIVMINARNVFDLYNKKTIATKK